MGVPWWAVLLRPLAALAGLDRSALALLPIDRLLRPLAALAGLDRSALALLVVSRRG
jgi:hypothetical protein